MIIERCCSRFSPHIGSFALGLLLVVAAAWSTPQPEPAGSAASYPSSGLAASAALSIVDGDVSTRALPGSPFIPVLTVIDAPAAGTDADDATTATFALPADGDLSGDGRDDVLVVRTSCAADLVAVRVYDHRSDTPRINLLGVEGTKGKTLWHRNGYRTAPAGEAIWRLSVDNLRDVDGDGRADLLVASDNLWGDFSGGDVRRSIEILSGRKGRTHVSLVGD